MTLLYVLLESSTHIPHIYAPWESTLFPGWNELISGGNLFQRNGAAYENALPPCVT